MFTTASPSGNRSSHSDFSSGSATVRVRRSLADYTTYLFDIDGTLLYPGGAIPGAAATITYLKAHGKTVRAVTNNSSLSRQQLAARLRDFGLPFDTDEVFSALTAAAGFIAREQPNARVHAFGSTGLRQELVQAGLVVTNKVGADYVLVGHHEDVGYADLKLAMRALLGGARFVAVNADRMYRGDDGLLPGCGVFVAALSHAIGRAPDLVVGKPATTILLEALAGIDHLSSCLFVGDNIEADIAVARAVGMDALLVLTGLATSSELDTPGLVVEHVLPSVADLKCEICHAVT